MSWPPCATPRSMSADSPDTPTSPPPNATTAGHPTPPSTPSSPHDQLDRRRSAPFHDLAMPLLSGPPRDTSMSRMVAAVAWSGQPLRRQQYGQASPGGQHGALAGRSRDPGREDHRFGGRDPTLDRAPVSAD